MIFTEFLAGVMLKIVSYLISEQVSILTLSQGLVTPGSSIPTLIAMSTDPLTKIRNKVENMLKDIDSKYAGMVPVSFLFVGSPLLVL